MRIRVLDPELQYILYIQHNNKYKKKTKTKENVDPLMAYHVNEAFRGAKYILFFPQKLPSPLSSCPDGRVYVCAQKYGNV
jgi:hypothetical protein